MHLRLQRRRPIVLELEPAPRAAVITQISAKGRSAWVVVSSDGGNRFALARFRGKPVSELDVEDREGHASFEIRAGQIVVPEGATVELSLVTDRGELPIRRRHTDLKDPGYAVPLPTISGSDPRLERPELRLVYRPTGQLGVRRLVQPEAGQR